MKACSGHLSTVLRLGVGGGWQIGRGGICDRNIFRTPGGAGAARLGGDPAGFQWVGIGVGPYGGYSKGQDYVMQLGIAIGLVTAPGALFPGEVFERGVTLAVQTGTGIDEALGCGSR